MNLSQVQVELEETPREDIAPKLRAEEARLLRIIEALQELSKRKEWSTLKTEVFDNLVNVLERDLKTEAERPEADPRKLNRISGELKWAKRFSDLGKYEAEKLVELHNIRKQLH